MNDRMRQVVEYFLNDSRCSYSLGDFSHPEPSSVVVKNALLTKPILSGEASVWRHPVGAVYDSSGRLVEQSRMRDKQQLDEYISDLSPSTVFKGNYIYLGYYNEVYGHFLLESLSRLWVLDGKRPEEYKYVFHSMHNNNSLGKEYCRKVLQEFGVNAEAVTIINENASFESLIVPSSLSFIGTSQHPHVKGIYNRIFSNITETAESEKKNIYVSRRFVRQGNHKFINEDEVEKIFTEFGFEIVHPEKISIEDQIRAYRSANVIAGPLSSALHNSVFCADGTTVIALNGRWTKPRPKKNRISVETSARSVQDFICVNYNQPIYYIEAQRAFEINGAPIGRMPYWICGRHLKRILSDILQISVPLHADEIMSEVSIRNRVLESSIEYFESKNMSLEQNKATVLLEGKDIDSMDYESTQNVKFLPNKEMCYDKRVENIGEELSEAWQPKLEISSNC